tara:strand:+ start:367 stop:1470 length:1104 start_codon:yes stop_codon:yes gene_type:complete
MSTLLIDIEKSNVKTNDALTSFGESEQLNSLTDNTDPQLRLSPRKIINVVDDFAWYSGAKASAAALQRVPKACIIEREQQLSSIISGALYYISTVGKSKAVNELSSKVTSLLKGINADVISGSVDKVRGFLKGVEASSDSSILSNSNLKSLIGIYLTEETGFQYAFPHFDSMPDITNTWSKGGSNSGLQSMVSVGMEAVEEIANIAYIAQPGVYIQKPQYYEFEDAGKTITINFPLFNTVDRGTLKSYQLNYELLWLLAFQNKPYKTSFARTAPPKIYSINVPGICAFPYSYISNMTVDFKGTVRYKNVSLPHLKGGVASVKSVRVPIPDAYTVSLTFNSLLADYANLMVSDYFTAEWTDKGVKLGS